MVRSHGQTQISQERHASNHLLQLLLHLGIPLIACQVSILHQEVLHQQLLQSSRLLLPSFNLSCEVNNSSSIPTRLHANINCPAVLTKGLAINGNADEGVLIASLKYSRSRFCQVRFSWFPNSNLLNSAFCWVAQLRHLRDTPQSSFFRQSSSSFMVSRAIHQGRAVFIVAFLSRGSLATRFPVAWCSVESQSLLTSTSYVCPSSNPFWCLPSEVGSLPLLPSSSRLPFPS